MCWSVTRGFILPPRADRGVNCSVLSLPSGEGVITDADISGHDVTDRARACLLAALQPPLMPVALGVLYCDPDFDPAPSYERRVADEVAAAAGARPASLAELLHKGHTWTVS